MSSADRAKLDHAIATMRAEITVIMQDALPEYLDRVTEVYARTYTLSELHGIAAFYKSLAGQAVLAKQPQIAEAVVAVAQTSLLPKMEARMPAIIKKIEADLGGPGK